MSLDRRQAWPAARCKTVTTFVDTTAYCGCGRCCGWEYGVGLGPLPLYLPIAWKKRASGNQPIPLLPRVRRLEYETEDRRRGALSGAAVGSTLAGAACIALAAGCLPPSGRLGTAVRFLSSLRASSSFPPGALLRSVQAPVAVGAALGGVSGYALLPISKYWAETNLAGQRYAGTTASNTRPRAPVPPLFSKELLRSEPWTIPHRLLLLRWRGTLGTVAADTTYFRFGERIYVPGYGWGVVEDRGGGVKGSTRLDLYHRDHQSALNWGRRTVQAKLLAR
mmetsp:Transcript_25099/g.44733  ORF Transcript_25099/g.44733 Transcript_25099/m.44733 type:complete len:279 (+) Transcript_25099:146-982(+)|eukprot:CAMPEP_0177786212 /NCGR_PEP_ID=MMETSP0491_2-20121128/20796_1 /TAXON_ID=63592 /ORGANISM="Tetraselmis chuii, Strain PLY429" /LENGTH=278 /DNA_ID=CAMNT_0019307395 /DNA_START=38 /DNA_END=874 /DNA_ORIENTATION=+